MTLSGKAGLRLLWGSILILSMTVNGYAQKPGVDPAGLDVRVADLPKISLDFRDADIKIVAKFISEVTAVNFILSKSIKGRVTLFVPEEVDPDQAYQLFESVLKLNGYTTIPGKLATLIVDSSEARTMGLEVRLSELGD